MKHDDEQFMQRALEQAQRARYHAPPNPWVGCVVVKDGVIVGEGYSQSPGGAHAEVEALRSAGERAQGATAYVTLEPCAHHGRTPPCTGALIRSGVSRVVAAIEDPDPRVAGRGFSLLQAAGIQVQTGILADQAIDLLRPYLHHRRTKRPYCLLKAAVSLDGRIAAQDGTSQWISCAEARTDAHQLRAESQAILVGVNTARKDHCALTVRNFQAPGMRQPLRVVLDTQGRLPATGPLFDSTLAPTLLVTGTPQHNPAWHDSGVEVAVLPTHNGSIDLAELLNFLGARGVLQLLVEGGASVFNSFWQHNLVDQLRLYIGPRLLGQSGLPLFAGLDIPTIEEAPFLQPLASRQVGKTFCIDFIPS